MDMQLGSSGIINNAFQPVVNVSRQFVTGKNASNILENLSATGAFSLY